jgi:hypothetical protein
VGGGCGFVILNLVTGETGRGVLDELLLLLSRDERKERKKVRRKEKKCSSERVTERLRASGRRRADAIFDQRRTWIGTLQVAVGT